MDTDGVVLDTANGPKVSKEMALKMYRDMVAGMGQIYTLVKSEDAGWEKLMD